MATISFVSRFAKLKNITKPIKTKYGLVNENPGKRPGGIHTSSIGASLLAPNSASLSLIGVLGI